MSIQEITPGALYTLGYHEPDAASRLSHLMSDPKTLLIDIRYRARAPWSRTWTKKALKATYGERYLHLRYLGNVNYQDPQLPIHLLNPGKGIPQCVDLLEAGFSLVLLCACQDYERCHRKTVYEILKFARVTSECAAMLQPPIEGLSEQCEQLMLLVEHLNTTLYPLARLHLIVQLVEVMIRSATTVRRFALDAALTFAEVERDASAEAIPEREESPV